MTIFALLIIGLAVFVPRGLAQATGAGETVGSTPPVVSDTLAYTHLFYTLSKATTEDYGLWDRRRRAYAASIGLAEQDAGALLKVSEEFQQKVIARGTHPVEIVSRSRSGSRRTDLIQERDRIVEELALSLRDRLSPEGFEALQVYVNDRLKPTIRLVKTKATQGGAQ